MNVTIITDCRDENAKGRQIAKAASLFDGQINFIGIKKDLEAAGNLIDVLDVVGEADHVILVNVAPRDGEAKKWPNGTPFAYFKYKNSLVVSSIQGYALSLVKKFGLVAQVNLVEIPTVLPQLVSAGFIKESQVEEITSTQFRSLNYLPVVALALLNGHKIDSEVYSLSNIKDVPVAVWWIDNFGNCKATVTAGEDDLVIKLATTFQLERYDRLKDVPNAQAAIIEGSSGLEDRRFIEIVVQGGSAAKTFDLDSSKVLV